MLICGTGSRAGLLVTTFEHQALIDKDGDKNNRHEQDNGWRRSTVDEEAGINPE